MHRAILITVVAGVGLALSLPAVADARPAFSATAADNGLCTVLVTASWSGARVNSVDFALTTNAATYDSAPVPLGGTATVQRSGWMQHTFTTTLADVSGHGVVAFLNPNGRVVGTATTDPVDIACA